MKQEHAKRQRVMDNQDAARVKDLIANEAAHPKQDELLEVIDDSDRASIPFQTHVSHDAFYTGGYVFCQRCYAIASCPAKADALIKLCTGLNTNPSKGAASRIARLRKGLHRVGMSS